MRVLIIEDNEALAQTTGWMAEAAGHDYALAFSPEEALGMVLEYQPHLAILDIGLPGINGFDLCRSLRAMPALRQTKFLAQTGTSTDEYRHKAREAGFEYYITKPFLLDELLAVLSEIEADISRV